ncbi:MAG: leucine-rich repeat protein [Lachnospiraceae bacterium]|nr:leucine-rich repeat protein [Lachnospiraceae bacterium]
MKKRILSMALALCLCISFPSVAVHAWQEAPLPQGGGFTEVSISGLTAMGSTAPDPKKAYEAMIALKNKPEYMEGVAWTNETPYSDSKGYYKWKGGPLDGKNISAVGCVAFAFILSDAAFGDLPARMYAKGGFSYGDIKVGDILRVNNDAHTVIVLQVHDTGVIVAEGNISTGDHKGKVHWGRAISKKEVMDGTSHYITRYPQGYVPPSDPDANVSIGSGNMGEGLTWNLTKAGTLTVSGKGAMPNYSGGGQPWSSYNSKIWKVVIGNGVTSIGDSAFTGCGVLSAEISPSVTTIGNHAFKGSSLISITIPSSVRTIGNGAFQECINLKSATVLKGVETIGSNAFRSCTSLTSIALPSSVGEVGAGAFLQCTAMTSATFASGGKRVKMGENMFTGCYYLGRVILPRNIDCISEGMFQNCLMLPEVQIPQGAESIQGSAFASSGVSTVVIPHSVTSIGIAAFADCPLRDIKFTGTQAQWNGVRKLGDTIAVMSKIQPQYNYIPTIVSVPEPEPEPDDSDDNNNGDNTTGGDNSTNGGNTSREDIAKATVTLSKTSYTYDGKAKKPTVTVKLGSKKLTVNKDYTVSYSNNTKIGTGKVTVTGKGDYKGSKSVSFKIVKKQPSTKITCKKMVYKVAYGAKPFKISASSKSKMTFTSSKPKIAAVDKKTGKVTVKNTGIATITIKAGDASKKVTIKVNPKKQSVKTAKPQKGKKLAITWTKDKKASGYQVQISTDKKFKKNVKSKNLSKTSYTFTKLSTGKKYYVRVRSYKKSGKETLYGAWSSAKLSGKMKK